MWVRCHSGNGTKDREEKGGVVIKGLPDFLFDFFVLKVQLSKCLCHIDVMGVVTGTDSNPLSVITCPLPFK